MKKISKILIITVVILFVIAGIFVSGKFFSINKGSSEKIEITKIKSSYATNENIVVAGQAKKDTNIIFSWDNQLGMAKSDSNGAWIVNLGTMPEGNYALEAIADDSPSSRSVVTAQISVVSGLDTVSLINKISGFLTASLSLNQEKIPEKLVMIPENIPPSLGGEWSLIK